MRDTKIKYAQHTSSAVAANQSRRKRKRRKHSNEMYVKPFYSYLPNLLCNWNGTCQDIHLIIRQDVDKEIHMKLY